MATRTRRTSPEDAELDALERETAADPDSPIYAGVGGEDWDDDRSD